MCSRICTGTIHQGFLKGKHKRLLLSQRGSGLLGRKVPPLNCVLHYETDVSEMKLQRIISTVKDPIQ